MDNSKNRLHSVFFYGLYMAPDILRAKSVEPRNPRKAVAKGYRVRVGKMATLLRDANATAHGMVYDLTHGEIHKLYWASGLSAYVAEALEVTIEGQRNTVALCCNLLVPPAEDETNPEYLDRLVQCMNKLGLVTPGV